jgi:gliding motility-associated-like protein
MKKLFTIALSCCLFYTAHADHITGGQVYYTYLGINGTNHQYHVTLKLFMRCNSGRAFNNPTIVSIFDRSTNARVFDLTVPLASRSSINLNNNNPCITNPPVVCYDVGLYEFVVSLPENQNGYLLASQVNYRISGISNMEPNYSQIGATYTSEFPGTADGVQAMLNNSAMFTGSDLVVVCANNSFTYSFAATDPDSDELRYSFCGAYRSTNPGLAAPPYPPPFDYIPYGQGYNENKPLGDLVQINPQTGLISGIAPPAGVYVVTVCVEEIRDGKVIAIQRKDLQIRITECTIAAATLAPSYSLCKETTSLTLSNLSTSPLINTYSWEIRDSEGIVLYNSTNPSINYNFQDTGMYVVSLAINQGETCPDSTTSPIRVYPGMVTEFGYFGQCSSKPTQFIDSSYTPYGSIISWQWSFEQIMVPPPTSNQRNPVYSYTSTGSKYPSLIVTTTKGCSDTLTKEINIFDKPPLHLLSRDTLICRGDTINVQAFGNGNFSWQPEINIINSNSSNPSFFPASTTQYIATLDDHGCINSDTVNIRVVNFVSLQMPSDTTICEFDPAKLRAITDGLKFSWSPPENVEDPFKLHTLARPSETTSYQLTSSIGKCSTSGNFTVAIAPYPEVNAGSDTTICFGHTAQLNGSSNGSTIAWSPASSISNPYALITTAKPANSTSYILTATGNGGCPKPSSDTVVVTVMPRIEAWAGNDTAIVANQPLQLNASGGVQYYWSPADHLSLATIPDPVAIFNENDENIRYTVYVFDDAGCVDSASIAITIYTTPPIVFVPNAFTPNNDGRNDVLRPIAVGMGKIEYFRIYNRWGQLVFQTTVNGRGWDGRINGKEQKTDNYVWEVKATDFRGNPYFGKGTVTLIR